MQTKEQRKQYYQKTKKIRALQYQQNKEKLKQKQKDYYNANKEKNKLYRENNKERISNYYLKNKDKIIKHTKEYYLANKEHLDMMHKLYMQKNRKRTNELAVYRRKTDIQFKLKHIFRNRLRIALKGSNKQQAIKYLGYTIEECKKYLENQFKPGMDWQNHSRYGWHIDHIIPLSKFDLTQEDQLKIACHYTNLQPLWAKENISKSNKII